MTHILNRDNSIDIAKGLGIIMVVFCHANFAPMSPFRFFHMALFFFISGWLQSFHKEIGSFLIGKIRHLYFPFLICELIFLLLHTSIFEKIGISLPYQYSPVERITRILLFDNIEVMLSPLWFITAIFFVNYICRILIGCFRDRKIVLFAISIVLFTIGLAGTKYGWFQLPSIYFREGVNVVLVSQFFTILGWLLKQLDMHWTSGLVTLIGLVYLYVAKLILVLSVDMHFNRYSSLPLWIVATCLGIYATMYIASTISEFTCQNSFIQKGMNRIAVIFAYLGRHSLLILMLHIFCFKLVGLIQVYCFDYDITLLPLWDNLSKDWYWALAYSFSGLLIPSLLRLCYDFVSNKIITSNLSS